MRAPGKDRPCREAGRSSRFRPANLAERFLVEDLDLVTGPGSFTKKVEARF